MLVETRPRILDRSFRPYITPSSEYILQFRYLARRDDGSFEEPVEMFRRVAWNLAEAEREFQCVDDDSVLAHANRFFTTMTDFTFLPNAPTLLGAGRELQQLSACYVLPVEDSIDGIFETLRKTAIIHSKGSGTGFCFSGLRPRGAPIATGGVSTGPVSFMHVFDAETEVIKNGGTGWGANMGVLRCDHPDIKEFVTAKASRPGLGSGLGPGLQNFNLSVGMTDELMDLCRRGGALTLRCPASGQPMDQIDAGELLDMIAQEAWRTGDPGLLFLDRMERDNPTPELGRLETTNPCGEAPLLPYEACWLGGINVAAHLDDNGGDVDWAAMRDTAFIAARMMDNAIEASRYPLSEIREATHRTRKIGVGIMGFADLLIRMGIPYGSDQSVSLAGELMRRIHGDLEDASVALAEERGTFPAFDGSVHARGNGRQRRNATVSANAPNSTIAAIAGCSQGIEPLFSIAFQKLLANGDRVSQISAELLQMARDRGFYSEALVEAIAEGAALEELSEVPADIKQLFVTAHDVSADDHIRVQAAVQENTELAVAKTINLPREASREDVKRAYVLAHESGCKGITVFRDGCRDRPFLERAGVEEADAVNGQCPVCL